MATKFFVANPPAEELSKNIAGSATSKIGANAGNLINIGGLPSVITPIDVGPANIIPVIIRSGKEITPPAFNTNKIDDFISHTSVLPRLFLPVTISQSIPAGTMVAKGTPIDIVLVPASNLSFGLLDQVHADMTNLAITDALPIVNDPQVAPLLSMDVSSLNSDQVQLISQKLSTLKVTVDDTNPAKTFALAFNALKAAQAFA